MTLPNFYTREELAEILKVNIITIDRWRKAGLLKGQKIKRTVRFTENEVMRFIETQLNDK